MTTIILTSTVNVNLKLDYLFQINKTERINTYLKSILQWLNKTNFNIVLVDNSGYNYDELANEKEVFKNRFEVISFIETEIEEAKYLEYNRSKGASEIFAIHYAYYNSNLIKQTNFIIKITARFFIPELEGYLSNYDLNNYDCLTQFHRNRCEMVGSHLNNFSNIFNIDLIYKNNESDFIENIYNERTSNYEKILICKNFEIEQTQRGGVNQCFYDI